MNKDYIIFYFTILSTFMSYFIRNASSVHVMCLKNEHSKYNMLKIFNYIILVNVSDYDFQSKKLANSITIQRDDIYSHCQFNCLLVTYQLYLVRSQITVYEGDPHNLIALCPGLTTSDRQVRVLLRDIAGKACWDASALYYDPTVGSLEPPALLPLPEK